MSETDVLDGPDVFASPDIYTEGPGTPEPSLRPRDDIGKATYRAWLKQFNDLLDCAWFKSGYDHPLRHSNWALAEFRNTRKAVVVQELDNNKFSKRFRTAYFPAQGRLDHHRRARTKKKCVWMANGFDHSDILMMLFDVDVREPDADPDGAARYISETHFAGHTHIEPSSSGRGRHIYFFVSILMLRSKRRSEFVDAVRSFGVAVRSDPALSQFRCQFDAQPIYGVPTLWEGTRGLEHIPEQGRGNLCRVPFLLDGSADLDIMQRLAEEHAIPAQRFLDHHALLTSGGVAAGGDRMPGPTSPLVQPGHTHPTPPPTTVMKHTAAEQAKLPVDRPEEECFITVVGGGVVVGGGEARDDGGPARRMWACGVALSNALGRPPTYNEVWAEYHRLGLNTGNDEDGGRARCCDWTATTLVARWKVDTRSPRGRGDAARREAGDLTQAIKLVRDNIGDEIRKSVRQQNRSSYTDQEAALVLHTIELSALTRNRIPRLQFTAGNNSFEKMATLMGITIEGKEGQRRMRWGAIKKALIRAELVEELEGGNWSAGRSKKFGLGSKHPTYEDFMKLKREFQPQDQEPDLRPKRARRRKAPAITGEVEWDMI